jgi:hypothetical protein
MMPTEPLRDIMRRTIANLEFIERKATPSGPFEVTQLVNSYLGALAHPWERLRVELNEMPLGSAGWPAIRKERDSDDDRTRSAISFAIFVTRWRTAISSLFPVRRETSRRSGYGTTGEAGAPGGRFSRSLKCATFSFA